MANYQCSKFDASEDYYAIIGVEENADDNTIHRACLRLKIKSHSDMAPNRKDIEANPDRKLYYEELYAKYENIREILTDNRQAYNDARQDYLDANGSSSSDTS